MKKISMLLFLLLVISNMFGQIEADLPILSPKSPNAFEFTKYGEVDINESSGTINPSIPLYLYKSGEDEVNINLQYSGNGVKVAQEPTWVGINWSLAPGGIITREVRDQPDEKTNFNNKKYLTKSDLDNFSGLHDYNNSSTQWYTEINNIASNIHIDSETDIFNYNFVGYSGSFFLDKEMNAHLIKYNKEITIDFDYMSNNKSFITIKTPDGTTYFFGGDASESSRTWVNNGSGSTNSTDYTQNAFYLYQISPYKGGFIKFHYEDINVSSFTNPYQLDPSETITKLVNSECPDDPILDIPYNYDKKNLYNDIERIIYLKKITSSFNDNSIQFNSVQLSGTSKRKLNSIYINDKNNNLIQKFELKYLNVNTETQASENRFFLEQVDFYGKDSKICDYKLEYDSPGSLPSKRSYARDYGGYYNGKTTNQTLLPKGVPFFDNTINLADRNPDPKYAKYGSLKRIYYPTGGYTDFEYELPLKDSILETKDEYTLNVYHNDPTRYGESDYEEILHYNTDGVFTFKGGEKIDFDLKVTATGSMLPKKHYVTIIADKISGSGNEPEHYVFDIGSTQNTTINYNDSGSILIPSGGTYIFRFKLVLYGTTYNSNSVNITAQAKIKIPSDILTYRYYPGLRIASVNNVTQENSLYKRFYYNSRDKIHKENRHLINEPQYTYYSARRINCHGIIGLTRKYWHLTANAMNNVYLDDSGKILYPNITISYGGNNFENGGIEKVFKAVGESIPNPYLGEPVYCNYGNNFSYQNGTLLKETTFGYNNNIFSIKQEKEFKYKSSYSYVQSNIKVNSIIKGTGTPNVKDFNIALYDIYSFRNELSSTITTDYHSSGSITKKEDYIYNSYVGQPSIINTTNSMGELVTTKMLYPQDVIENAINLTESEKNIINNLHTKHIISDPYMIEEYVNNNILSRKQIIYSNEWDNLILPKKIVFGNGEGFQINSYQDRVIFKDYNFHGRPVELHLADGPIVKYSYDEKQRVTRKIENYDSNNVIVDDGIPFTSPCYFQNQHPNSLLTLYKYDPLTNNLIEIEDSKCQKTFFEYDQANRLEFVKDHNNNIVSKNEYRYKN